MEQPSADSLKVILSEDWKLGGELFSGLVFGVILALAQLSQEIVAAIQSAGKNCIKSVPPARFTAIPANLHPAIRSKSLGTVSRPIYCPP